MQPANIIDGKGTTSAAKVTTRGEIIVSFYEYDDVKYQELAEPNVGYNFFEPLAGHNFVVTGMTIKADKQVSGTTEATIILYEASSVDATTVDKVLYQTVVLQYDTPPLPRMNIKVNAGKWVNAKTTDDDIHWTVFGYYIPA